MSHAAAPLSAISLSNALSGLVRDASRSIVGVHSRRSRASGFFWRPGLIVTASDPLADEGPIEVALPGGERTEATLKGRDPSTDITLLRIDRADSSAVTASTEPLDTGSLIVVVGAYEGTPSAALGIVSRVGAGWQSLRGGEMGARIELDVALRASAEGGA